MQGHDSPNLFDWCYAILFACLLTQVKVYEHEHGCFFSMHSSNHKPRTLQEPAGFVQMNAHGGLHVFGGDEIWERQERPTTACILQHARVPGCFQVIPVDQMEGREKRGEDPHRHRSRGSTTNIRCLLNTSGLHIKWCVISCRVDSRKMQEKKCKKNLYQNS